MAKDLGLTNMNGVTEDEDTTCGINDMNCVENQEEKSASITDMNSVSDEEDTTCGLTDMNCTGE